MENTRDFGEVLELVGSSGKFQKFLLYAVAAPIAVIVPVLCLSPIFMFQVPDHWCRKGDGDNITELSTWKNHSLPMESGLDGIPKYSKCSMYNDSITKTVVDCQYGWDYDRTDLVETFASQFDWVCRKEHYSTTIFTIIHAGTVAGTIVFGLLADRIGRKPVFFLSLAFYLFFRLACFIIPQHFMILSILTFISSMGYPMVNLIPAMILAEITNDAYRSWSFALLFGAYVVGAAAIPYICYFCSHWFTIGMVTTLPSLGIFLYWFAMNESPRWLTSVGRTKEAAEILWRIGEVNGRLDQQSITVGHIEKALSGIYETQMRDFKKPSPWMLLGSSTLAKRMLLIIICWCSSNLIYETITLNTPNMSGDQFLNFFLLFIVEAPSTFLGGFLLGSIGRRWSATFFQFMTAVACFTGAVVVTMPSLSIVSIVATFIAKFAENITYLIIYLQATEILPTPLRATGTSLASTMSSIVSTLVPAIVFTTEFHAGIPYFVMGCVALISTVAASFLPETIYQDLPESVEDANQFGGNNKFWTFRAPKRKTTEHTEQISIGNSLSESFSRRGSICSLHI